MTYTIRIGSASSMSQHEELCCVPADMVVLTTIKAHETVGNPTPVNKPYVINTNRNEVLPVMVPDNPYIPFHGRGNSIGEKYDTGCKTELRSSCNSDDNEETADEMTFQGQRSGHIPASVGLKRCQNMADQKIILAARKPPVFRGIRTNLRGWTR